MKSKKISLYSLEDVTITIGLMSFLLSIGINSAEEKLSELTDTQSEDFCEYCENHNDDCGCNDVRYMAEYDDGASYED